MADPGSGEFRLNHATAASITSVAFSAFDQNSGANSLYDYVDAFDGSPTDIRLVDMSDNTNFLILRTDASSAYQTDFANTHVLVTISSVQAKSDTAVSNIFSSGRTVQCTFAATGAKGQKGAAGGT